MGDGVLAVCVFCLELTDGESGGSRSLILLGGGGAVGVG